MMIRFKTVGGLLLGLLVFMLAVHAQADALYLRNGWDMVNNVADPGGYSGTRAAYGLERSPDTVYTNSNNILWMYHENGSYDGYGAAVIDFALPSVLEGMTVSSAKLALTYCSGWQNWGTLTFVAREPTKQWVQGEASYKSASTGDLWIDPFVWYEGMRMTEPNLDSVPVYGHYMPGVSFELDISNLVQSWIDDPSNQKGVAVTVLEHRESWASTNEQLASYEHATVNWRPMLQIEYTPEPATLSLLGCGLVLGLLRRKR